MTSLRQSVIVKKHSSYVLLKCQTINSPATNVTWKQDGASIQPNGDYIVMEQYLLDRERATYENTLRIVAEILTSGTFNCSVRNVLGSANAHINVSVCKFHKAMWCTL